jgi:hypothetical protein
MRLNIQKSSLAVVIALSLAIPALSAPQTKTLADGVCLVQDINTSSASPLVVNMLRIDPKAAGVKISAALGRGGVIEPDPTEGRESISTLVGRTGALAGINADFFPFTGDPLGLAIIGGELVSEPMNRAAIGLTSAGEVLCDKMGFSGTITSASGVTWPLGGLNRPRGKNELVLYTPIFGANTGTKDGVEIAVTLDGPVRANADVTATVNADPGSVFGSLIPRDQAILSAQGRSVDWLVQNVHTGDKIKLRFDIKAASGRSWDNVVEAVGGGPCLLKNGQPSVDAAEENFKPSFSTTRHPRTAAGVTSAGELILVTVDGRQSISQGVSLAEMAALMKKLGAVDAINLDGGGSTTLSAKGVLINSPSDGAERPVADALLIYATSSTEQLPTIKFADAGPLTMNSGAGRMLSLVDDTTCKPIADDVTDKVVWGTTGGVGFVNQKGYFTPLKTGQGKIVALLGTQRIELQVFVVPCKPTSLTAKLVADPSGAPNRAQLNVTLSDAYGNGVAGRTVTISVKGGIPDSPTVTTDSKGQTSVGITLDSTRADAKVTVSSSGLTARAK